MQTLGLILKDADFFGVLGALNLDLESATGQCVAPLTTTQRFYAKASLTPAMLVLGTPSVIVCIISLLLTLSLSVMACCVFSSVCTQTLGSNGRSST